MQYLGLMSSGSEDVVELSVDDLERLRRMIHEEKVENEMVVAEWHYIATTLKLPYWSVLSVGPAMWQSAGQSFHGKPAKPTAL